MTVFDDDDDDYDDDGSYDPLELKTLLELRHVCTPLCRLSNS